MCRHARAIALVSTALLIAVAPVRLTAAEPDALPAVLRPLGWLDRSALAAEPAADEPSPADARSPYVAGMIGSSFAGPDSSGLGGTLLTGEGALGVSVPRPLGAVRLEVEGRQRAALSGTRPAAAGGAGPPVATATIGAEWTTMANVWRDVSVADHLSLYAGGGAGVGGYSHDADADGPAAATAVTAFGWQVGGGAAYAITDRLTLDVGCRFYGLEAGAGLPAAGPPATEMLFAVRISDPFRGWLRR
jgi:opacity protein-like surface antigen